MYYCTDCKMFIEDPVYRTVKKGAEKRRRALCPVCRGELIISAPEYCRYCGNRLTGSERDGFCTDACRRLGRKLWTKEMRRRKKIKDDPIARVLRMLAAYNLEHHTKYSYGQFVSLVLPKIERRVKKCYGF